MPFARVLVRALGLGLGAVTLAVMTGCSSSSTGGGGGGSGSSGGGSSSSGGSGDLCELSSSSCKSSSECTCGTKCLATNSSDSLCTVECTQDSDCAAFSDALVAHAYCASHGYGSFCQ
jgi:hypothetical protein